MQTMLKDNPDRIIIDEFIPIFDQIGGLNTNAIDYRLLKNRP